MKNWRFILLAFVLIMAFALPFIGIQTYFLHLISLSLIWVIMTQGLNIIQGYTGYISIAQASFFGIGAYASALLTIDMGLSFWIALPLSVIITGVAGVLIGYPALRTKGHYFAIVTMAFCVVVWLLMTNLHGLTGGEEGISNIPAPEIFGIDFADRSNYYYLILVFSLLSIFFVYRLINSKIGRGLITIRENEQLAQAIGVSLIRYKLLAFTLSAMLGGLSGSLYAHYLRFINPGAFTVDYSLNAILAVILGGSGTIIGPVIGSFLMIFIPESLRLADEYRLVIYGVVLILITIYMPKGVIHILKLGYKFLLKSIQR